MGIEPEPLSEATLDSAIACVRASFANIFLTGNLPERSLRASLNPVLAQGHADMQNIPERMYWVIVDGGRVAAISGLMTFEEDKHEADWVNWFCTHPDFRSKGYGKILLNKAIDECRKRGKPALRLWTTDSENEKTAQVLYEKMGFKIIGHEDWDEPGATKKIYREKIL